MSMARRGSYRASDEDRDRTVERLHKAATEGRIAAEELEHRVTAALKARTYDELDSTVADLPAPRPGRGREAQRRSVPQAVMSTVAHNPMLLLFAIPVVAVTAAMLLAATVMWAVLMVVVLVLGGRPRVGPPPWIYARRQAVRQVRRRTGGYWA
jgi:cation transport ATPase